MNDLAELTLSVNSAGVATASVRLDQLTAASGRSEVAAGRLRASFGLHEVGMGSLSLSYSRIIGLMSQFAAGAGIVGIAVKAIATAGQFEQTQIGLETMLGSAEKAKKMMAELKQFAAISPFQFGDLAKEARNLAALGTSAEDLLPTLKVLANTASAMGGGAEKLERIGLALGQIRQKGVLSGEEMRQLAEAGIPAWDMLAKKLEISVPEAMARGHKKMINAEVAIYAILEGMDKRYAGGMEKQSQSILGLWSTFKDNVTFFMSDLGDTIIEALDLRSNLKGSFDFMQMWGRVIIDVIRNLAGLQPKYQYLHEISEKVANVIRIIVDLFKIWIAIKIVVMIESMAVSMVKFALGMNGASIAARPLLSTILGIGAALASWSLGKALFEQFEQVRVKALGVISAVMQASHFINGPDGKTIAADKALFWENVQKYGQTTGTTMTAIEQLRANHMIGDGAPRQMLSPQTYALSRQGTLSDADQAVLDKRIEGLRNNNFDIVPEMIEYLKRQTLDQANKDFASSPTSLMDKWKANMAEASKAMAEGLSEASSMGMKAFGPDFASSFKIMKDMYEQLTGTGGKLTPPSDEAQLSGVKAMLGELQKKGQLVTLTNYQEERALAIQKATALLDGTTIKNKQEWIDKVTQQVELNARMNAAADIDKALAARSKETEVLHLHGIELEKEVAYRELVNKALVDGVPLNEEYLKGVREQSDAIVDLQDHWKQVWQMADDVGQAFGSAFEEGILGAKSFGEVMKGLLQDISRALIRTFVSQPLSQGISNMIGGAAGGGWLGSIGGAFAGLFGGGGKAATPAPTIMPPTDLSGMMKSANGNVFDRPSFSVFGEAGPEAVMPLTRGPDGKLGVRGGGGGNSTIVHMTVVTQDANSFVRSKRQITDTLKRSL